MMTIGQFAERTGLSVSALRFYADRGLLAPAEVDASSGYRRYAEAQVADGKLIRDLRRLDMPLSEITVALRRSEHERNSLIEQHLGRLERIVVRAHAIAQHMGIATTEETAVSTPSSTAVSTPSSTAILYAMDLAQALDQVLPAAGTDPEVPHLMSVLIEGKDGSIRLVATDRHRLAIRDLVPLQLGVEFSAVVPAATLVQWRGSLSPKGEVTLTFDEQNAHLTGSDTETGLDIDLNALLVPATFPDYEQFLVPAHSDDRNHDDRNHDDRNHVTSVQVDRGWFLTSLRAFEGTDTVVIETGDGELSLRRDQQHRSVDAICSGHDQRIGINPRYAIEAVENAPGAEIVLEIEDQLRPVLFRAADDGTYISLIMPFKLD